MGPGRPQEPAWHPDESQSHVRPIPRPRGRSFRHHASLLIVSTALVPPTGRRGPATSFASLLGYASHVLCSDITVSGQDPDRDYAENIAASQASRPFGGR